LLDGIGALNPPGARWFKDQRLPGNKTER